MPRDKNGKPNSAERASHENFLVGKGMRRPDARELLPDNATRKQIVDLLIERFRQFPKKRR